jgi:hypothetical protein
MERRLSVAANWFAEQLSRHWVGRVDLLFTSEAMNLANLFQLMPTLSRKPSVVYFHENQLPHIHTSTDAPLDLVNLNTANAATEIWFNSEWHRRTFLARAGALIERHPNLLVVQTLSKSRSLAGLRVGFACGQAPLVEALTRVKDSFNSYPLDRLAGAGAVAALEDEAWFRQTRDAIVDTREGLVLALEDLGFEVLPSQANFVFARHPERDAAELAAALRERAVLVRHFKQERIAQYLRISIGTREQCSALLAALSAILAGRVQ